MLNVYVFNEFHRDSSNIIIIFHKKMALNKYLKYTPLVSQTRLNLVQD